MGRETSEIIRLGVVSLGVCEIPKDADILQLDAWIWRMRSLVGRCSLALSYCWCLLP